MSTTAVLLVHKGERAVVRNTDAANSVSLGGSGVGAATGYELKAGIAIDVVAPSDDVYGIRTNSADVRVDVLATRSTD